MRYEDALYLDRSDRPIAIRPHRFIPPDASRRSRVGGADINLLCDLDKVLRREPLIPVRRPADQQLSLGGVPQELENARDIVWLRDGRQEPLVHEVGLLDAHARGPAWRPARCIVRDKVEETEDDAFGSPVDDNVDQRILIFVNRAVAV